MTEKRKKKSKKHLAEDHQISIRKEKNSDSIRKHLSIIIIYTKKNTFNNFILLTEIKEKKEKREVKTRN